MVLTNEDLLTIKEIIQPLNDDMQEIKKRIADVETGIRSLELTLENETNRNISIVAEGHLDLIRKLNEALKIENEKEMLLIRVNRLENELRKIKEQLSA